MTRATQQHEARRRRPGHPSVRGFTLMELMVVMGIIVLLLSMGVLAFNAITGRRSVSMGQNEIAAMIGRARAFAMRDTGGVVQSVGVLFFLDPQTDQTAMTIVVNGVDQTGDPDPNNQYKAWTQGMTYQVADRVVAITKDLVEDGGVPGGGKPMARRFYCKLPHLSGPANCPPLTGTTFPFQNEYWQEVEDNAGLEVYPGEDIVLLPPGIGVQTVMDGVNNADRYLRTGVILFDQQGRLENLPYSVQPGTAVGQRLGLTVAIGGNSLYSQLGVVLYETEPFRNQPLASEADRTFQLPGQVAPSATDEANEELWLDQNTSLLLVNRYSGELLRAR